ncbi:MAG: cytochrome c peroxidase, partial [Flavobacteriales bacterium]
MGRPSLAFWILSASLAAVWAGCRPDPTPPFTLDDVRPAPPHFPDMDWPEDNPLNEAKWELGRHLFFDTRLSAHGDVSCATCHNPSSAMADNQPVTPGTGGLAGNRNASALVNLGWQPRFHMEGGVPSLETQALA